ncbi:MAG: hypothetical protein ACSHYF_12310 [Verrucomicrobiaceae bacterium]
MEEVVVSGFVDGDEALVVGGAEAVEFLAVGVGDDAVIDASWINGDKLGR